MDLEIGPTLREARIRRKIDLSEVEQRTKIRVRYLRALENEEWDVLPGGSYTRSFIRTYGSFLGLDGDRLADEFRRLYEDPLGTRYPHVEPVLGSGGGPSPPGIRGPRLGAGGVTALVAAALVAILIVIGVTVGDDDEPAPQAGARSGKAGKRQGKQQRPPAQARDKVAVRLTAIADVWVCMVNQQGVPVVNGLILAPGAQQGPFRSRKFDVTFGNGGIAMEVNGREVPVADTASPIGYELMPGKVRELGIAERPTCT
jgi:cytoskeleton protein RodZ